MTAGSAPCLLSVSLSVVHTRGLAHTNTQSCRTAVAAACQYSSVANRWIEDADETERERKKEIHLNSCFLASSHYRNYLNRLALQHRDGGEWWQQ